ncbi:hypothetical protein [Streptomyces melanogenes]|uniref:Uncharacterized protein n=1 Tax=Streptomyces melanogenes TaxID=67326 RepID=A0ABZ1XUU8_9ACTN|nr:hypothetical protein [Streptomyces melanogenes]
MTEPDDPRLVDAMWRATDLTRAYLAQDRSRVAACLVGLDMERLECVVAWLACEHDLLFERLGEPSMGVRELDAVAALAPPETEFATTAAVRRAKETGLLRAVEDLALLDQIHTLAVCTVVMLLEAYGRARALERVDADTAEYERRGYARPYPLT